MRSLLAAFAFLFALRTSALEPASGPAPCGASATVESRSFVRAHRCVSTENVDAQREFDDGLTLLYAFNPEEARRAFERAVHDDPSLAIAWWGISQSHGPNINSSYAPAEQRRGRDAIAKAASLAATATPIERALIAAASKRFAFDRASDADRSARAYRDAMYASAATYPQDDDVRTFAAEAEMDVHAWSYFTRDGKATPGTPSLIAHLEAVLARTPEHIGANHFAIHALEESAHPDDALAAANRLSALRLEPAAEHLIHMPAHIYMRVGDYHAAGTANARAVTSYLTYLDADPAGHGDYLGHDCVFGVDAFMMSGESMRAHALAAACRRNGGNLGTLVDLRFHDWKALAAANDAGAFVSGMLLAHDERIALAETHLKTLRASNDSLSALQADVLQARIARALGKSDEEIAALERAAKIQDGFGYSEPPAFWYPVRESLGGAYARAARFDDAARTFRFDLVQNSENPRSLFGLAETLARDGHLDESRAIRARFERAWRQADAELDLKDL